MLKSNGLDRRTFVAGAVVLTVSGCGENQSGSTYPGSGDETEPSAPTVWQNIVMIAGVIGVFATGGGFVGSLFGMARLAAFANRVSVVTDIIGAIDTASKMLGPLIPSAQASTADSTMTVKQDTAPPPCPTLPQGADSTYHGLDNVAFFAGPVTVNIACTNNTSVDNMAHNVYAVVRDVRASRPETVADMQSSSPQPFAAAMPHGEKIENPITFNDVQPGTCYAIYTWCIPTSVTLTDAVVRDTVMIGPLFYSCYSDDHELIGALRAEPGQSDNVPMMSYEVRRDGERQAA